MQFIDWITQGNPTQFHPVSVTLSDIRAWLAGLASQDAPTTLRRKTQSLRAWFRWMLKQGLITHNPAADVVLAKKPKHLPEYIREEEMEQILKNSEKEATTADRGNTRGTYINAFRNNLIIEILYATGLRQAELLGLRDGDISFTAYEAKVTGKRNKQRVVPLPAPLLEKIKEWQRLRDSEAEQPSTPSTPLFPGKKGAMSKMQLYRIVTDALGPAASSAKSPHVLRHTFATVMLNDGANLDTVREMLGHSSLTTTEIYTHLSFTQLLGNYKAAHPRAKK